MTLVAMICPRCNSKPADTDNFCMQCGTPKAQFLNDAPVPPQFYMPPPQAANPPQPSYAPQGPPQNYYRPAPQPFPPRPYAPAPQRSAEVPAQYYAAPPQAVVTAPPPSAPPLATNQPQWQPSSPPYPSPPVMAPSMPPAGPPMASGPMLMPQIASAAALRPNERLMQTWKAGLETIMDTEDGPTNTNLSGVLLATDQRLIFVQKKNILSSKYGITESLEYGNIASWKVRHLKRIKSLQVDLFQGRARQKVFNNLCEVDPGTLSALQPWTAESLHSLLQGLIAVRR